MRVAVVIAVLGALVFGALQVGGAKRVLVAPYRSHPVLVAAVCPVPGVGVALGTVPAQAAPGMLHVPRFC